MKLWEFLAEVDDDEHLEIYSEQFGTVEFVIGLNAYGLRFKEYDYLHNQEIVSGWFHLGKTILVLSDKKNHLLVTRPTYRLLKKLSDENLKALSKKTY